MFLVGADRQAHGHGGEAGDCRRPPAAPKVVRPDGHVRELRRANRREALRGACDQKWPGTRSSCNLAPRQLSNLLECVRGHLPQRQCATLGRRQEAIRPWRKARRFKAAGDAEAIGIINEQYLECAWRIFAGQATQAYLGVLSAYRDHRTLLLQLELLAGLPIAGHVIRHKARRSKRAHDEFLLANADATRVANPQARDLLQVSAANRAQLAVAGQGDHQGRLQAHAVHARLEADAGRRGHDRRPLGHRGAHQGGA
mmetsp:Transcript_35493/g.107207  ORF Transcript_35493/g.107207 Transcript_35493/m.107207 type:complete len:256 (-) Transcript_35493:25-792(-)